MSRGREATRYAHRINDRFTFNCDRKIETRSAIPPQVLQLAKAHTAATRVRRRLLLKPHAAHGHPRALQKVVCQTTATDHLSFHHIIHGRDFALMIRITCYTYVRTVMERSRKEKSTRARSGSTNGRRRPLTRAHRTVMSSRSRAKRPHDRKTHALAARGRSGRRRCTHSPPSDRMVVDVRKMPDLEGLKLRAEFHRCRWEDQDGLDKIAESLNP